MTLIHTSEPPKPYKLPKLAADVRVVDHKQDDRYRITDPADKFAGRSGVLELVKGKAYLVIDGWYHAVDLAKCVPVSLRVVK